MRRDRLAEIKDDPRVQALIEALLVASTDKELMGEFLTDLLSSDEMDAIANRWRISQLLLEGKSQRQTITEAKVSTVTVSRVAQWIKGPHSSGGVQAVFSILKQQQASHFEEEK